MPVELTIVGLGQTGASLGLALARYKEKIKCSGIDRDPAISERALKHGAVEKAFRNLQEAVEKADIVVLSVPADEKRETLEIIAPVLKEGAVVLDTSPNQQAAIQWADELFGPDRHFLTITPSLNPAYLHEAGGSDEIPHDDLFKQGIMAISCTPGTHSNAIRLATDLVAMLEAQPCFYDPLEADGLMAGSDLLPTLASVAFTLAVVDQPGWSEGNKLASRAFAIASNPVATLAGSKSLGQGALQNRESALRVLDNFIAELQDIRHALAEGDEKTLHTRFKHARDARADWWARRQGTDPDVKAQPSTPSMGEALGRFIGLGGKKKS